jgi:hypothetical protein
MQQALKYIFDMKRLPIILALVLTGVFFTVRTLGSANPTPSVQV